MLGPASLSTVRPSSTVSLQNSSARAHAFRYRWKENFRQGMSRCRPLRKPLGGYRYGASTSNPVLLPSAQHIWPFRALNRYGARQWLLANRRYSQIGAAEDGRKSWMHCLATRRSLEHRPILESGLSRPAASSDSHCVLDETAGTHLGRDGAELTGGSSKRGSNHKNCRRDPYPTAKSCEQAPWQPRASLRRRRARRCRLRLAATLRLGATRPGCFRL
jgi:hypothetical protein